MNNDWSNSPLGVTLTDFDLLAFIILVKFQVWITRADRKMLKEKLKELFSFKTQILIAN